MSEEREEEEEEQSIDHFYHEHPLVLRQVNTRYRRCYGCDKYISPRETAYVCREDCSNPINLLLHEACAEMPREMKVSMHPQHTLIQKQEEGSIPSCAVCGRGIIRMGYHCGSSDRCGFQIHIGCAHDMEVAQICITHPSHPQHQLSLFRRPGRSCWSRCDGCGTIERGDSYVCTGCQYWIHDGCANLSPTEQFKYHLHPLTLVYHLPLEYIRYGLLCDICLKDLIPRYWAYHCAICRFVAHVKCAIKDKGVIDFPLKNGVEEIIGSFVTKVGGLLMPNIPNDKIEYKFHNHDLQLHLVSSSSSLLHHQEEEEEEEEEEEDEEDSDDDDFSKLELMCDGCTTPIFHKEEEEEEEEGRRRRRQSSYKYYLSCGECKYLPPQIPFHPLHPDPHHNLTLESRSKLDFVECSICQIYTNGFFYGCRVCDFKVDIKCASLPDTIKHKAHPHHNLKLLSRYITRLDSYVKRLCGACGRSTFFHDCYRCDICGYIVHSSCALLPVAFDNPGWDKHRLRLSFNPGSFYCEEEMDPERWKYHCSTCNFSVHPDCFPAASGRYRNIKFGQLYNVFPLHHHPVAYQLLTKKLHCDVCGERKDYGCQGFQCASDKCDFFMCLHPCAADHKAGMKIV